MKIGSVVFVILHLIDISGLNLYICICVGIYIYIYV